MVGVDSAGFYESLVSGHRDLGHKVGGVNADHAPAGGASGKRAQTAAVTTTDVDDVIGFADLERINRSLILAPRFTSHDESDQPAERPRGHDAPVRR